ncbi:MAG: hypothetical protein JSR66_33240 [Proteobacteria bacterium]|nr:hypothetical protein [Pseudomonadota bacterium]
MPEDDFTVSCLVKARVHLEPLLHGVDPKTRDVIPLRDIINDPDIKGALRIAIGAIDEAIAGNVKARHGPPLAGEGSPAYGELRKQLDSLFLGFYYARDVIVVCRLALGRVHSPEDADVATVLSKIVLVRMNFHLRRLARLIKQMGGSTPYDDDEDDDPLDEEAYGEVALEDKP